MNLLENLFPDLPQPVHVERTPDGLLLPDGSTLHWPEDDTGVVLRFARDGELVGEWWLGESGYGVVMELFKQFPGRHDIVVGPRLRVIWPNEEESPDE